jgi:hypothetical protein
LDGLKRYFATMSYSLAFVSTQLKYLVIRIQMSEMISYTLLAVFETWSVLIDTLPIRLIKFSTPYMSSISYSYIVITA